MTVCGIISEYNPVHKGHELHIKEARERSGADFVVAAMSGDFMQRGTPGIADKYERAAAAIKAGADMVVMLPVCVSTASAEGFARGGVAALKACLCDYISFGCEDVEIASPEVRNAVSRLAVSKDHMTYEFKDELIAKSREGKPYAQAMCEVYSNILNPVESALITKLLKTPNNMLAFEYIKALEHFNIDTLKTLPIKRVNGQYHDLSDGAYSATACRKIMLEWEKGDLDVRLKDMLTEASYNILNDYVTKKGFPYIGEEDLTAMLHYALLTGNAKEFAKYADVSEDLANRIENFTINYGSYTNFADILNTRCMSRARIARALLHIVLRIEPEPYISLREKRGDESNLIRPDGSLSYIRVLAMRPGADELLHRIKKETNTGIVTTLSAVPEDAIYRKYFEQDIFASRIYRAAMIQKSKKAFHDDYNRHFLYMRECDD